MIEFTGTSNNNHNSNSDSNSYSNHISADNNNNQQRSLDPDSISTRSSLVKANQKLKINYVLNCHDMEFNNNSSTNLIDQNQSISKANERPQLKWVTYNNNSANTLLSQSKRKEDEKENQEEKSTEVPSKSKSPKIITNKLFPYSVEQVQSTRLILPTTISPSTSNSNSTMYEQKEESSRHISRRKRLNSMQLKTLNEIFQKTFYPSSEVRDQLAKKLDMKPRAIQIWFQNKRQSCKVKPCSLSTSTSTSSSTSCTSCTTTTSISLHNNLHDSHVSADFHCIPSNNDNNVDDGGHIPHLSSKLPGLTDLGLNY